jgi:hypothetical protein
MSGSRVIKGEPSAADAARLRRSLTDIQKAELRAERGAALRNRTGAVLNPPSEEPRA